MMTEPVAVNAPTKKRNRAARNAQITIAAVGIVALLLAGVYWVVMWPREPASGPAADAPIDGAPWTYSASSGTSEQDQMWTAMNDALLAKDREGFLAFATGDAAAQLSLWWDNTTAIGWDIAAVSPEDLEVSANNTQQVILGAQFAFAAHPERGSGKDDAALNLIQGSRYTFTYEPAADDDQGSSMDAYNDDGTLKEQEPADLPKITSVVPAGSPNPWDEGPIYVTKRDHVVLIGMAAERALVDQTIDIAESSAVIALDEIRELGGDLPQEGFLATITDDEQSLQRWMYGAGTPWDLDVAGFARPTLRPSYLESWLDPSIATGFDTSGTFVVLGPESAAQRQKTFVHEFAHALHHTAAPGSFADPPAAVMEGFARYVEWSAGVSEPGYTDPRVRDAVATRGAEAFDDAALRSQEASVAYDAAGSYYAFAASKGVSAWDIALYGRESSGGLVGYSELRPEVSIPEWQAWVAAQ